MNESECRALAIGEPVARLATHRADGSIDLVPVVFAFVDHALVFAVDHKPKSTQRLQRLQNIAQHPGVTVLFDRYEDDWRRLWWVRMKGAAREVDDDQARAAAIDALVAKYSQYAEQPPTGPVVQIEPTQWRGWRSTGS